MKALEQGSNAATWGSAWNSLPRGCLAKELRKGRNPAQALLANLWAVDSGGRELFKSLYGLVTRAWPMTCDMSVVSRLGSGERQRERGDL